MELQHWEGLACLLELTEELRLGTLVTPRYLLIHQQLPVEQNIILQGYKSAEISFLKQTEIKFNRLNL